MRYSVGEMHLSYQKHCGWHSILSVLTYAGKSTLQKALVAETIIVAVRVDSTRTES